MEESELKELINEAKHEAFEAFKKKSVGNDTEAFLNELKSKIKARLEQLREENEIEASQASHNFLSQSYSFIERKLKSREFNSVGEYEQELKAFQQYFLENGP